MFISDALPEAIASPSPSHDTGRVCRVFHLVSFFLSCSLNLLVTIAYCRDSGEEMARKRVRLSLFVLCNNSSFYKVDNMVPTTIVRKAAIIRKAATVILSLEVVFLYSGGMTSRTWLDVNKNANQIIVQARL